MRTLQSTVLISLDSGIEIPDLRNDEYDVKCFGHKHTGNLGAVRDEQQLVCDRPSTKNDRDTQKHGRSRMPSGGDRIVQIAHHRRRGHMCQSLEDVGFISPTNHQACEYG